MISRLLAVSALSLAAGLANGATTSWPPLPHRGFISGRAATAKDVAVGNAIFFVAEKKDIAKPDKGVGNPLRVLIPQYAYWRDDKGKQIRVIVIQAEEDGGNQIFGIRDFSGKDYMVTRQELTLLGKHAPK